MLPWNKQKFHHTELTWPCCGCCYYFCGHSDNAFKLRKTAFSLSVCSALLATLLVPLAAVESSATLASLLWYCVLAVVSVVLDERM